MNRSHQHPRRADSTLRTACLSEGLLQRMQIAVLRQLLNGADLGARHLHHRNKAAIHKLIIDQHGAGTTFALTATLLSPGQLKVITQNIEQPLDGVRLYCPLFAIYLERNRPLHGTSAVSRRLILSDESPVCAIWARMSSASRGT